MDIRKFIFKYRGFTPVPLILIVIIFAHPTGYSFFWGVLFMLLGESIRFWGVSYAGGATRTRKVGAPRLITSGPFARIRNPLYVGNILMYTGAGIIANVWLPWLLFGIWIFFGIQYYLIVKLEEEELLKLFGKEYSDYLKQVPRFLPKLKPISSKNPVHPDYLKAFRSEKSTYLSFTAILLLMFLKMYFTD